MSSEYVPVTEITSLVDNENAQLTWNFDLPPSLDAEHICLNIKALSRIQRFAVFSAIHINDYDGGQTLAQPVLDGFNNDGTATASRAKTIKADLHDNRIVDELKDSNPMLQADYGSTDVTIRLNKSEISSKVVDSKKVGTSREAAWASQLNIALGTAVRSAAKEHLLNRELQPLKTVGVGITALNASSAFRHIAQGDPTSTALSLFTIGGTPVVAASALMLLSHFQGGDTFDLKERRWSIFPFGFQADRYLGVVAASHAGAMVKYIK